MLKHETAVAIAWLFGLLCLFIGPKGASADDRSGLSPDSDGVIFSIGEANRDRNEFKGRSWTGVSVFECTVGIDCDADRFPMRLHTASTRDVFDSSAVERIVISFDLAVETDAAELVVARWGIENSVVKLDDGPPKTITSKMADPPFDEGIWGRFVLPLGPLEAGSHLIELSVEDIRLGSRRHSLDSISLVVAGSAPE